MHSDLLKLYYKVMPTDVNIIKTNHLGEKVDDQFVATLEISNSKCEYLVNYIEDIKSRKNHQLELQNSDYKILMIVLESPYEKEFNEGGYGPAQGDTIFYII